MTRMLTIDLLTLGDPGLLTGGYLYHRRMAEAAVEHDARIRFLSFPTYPFPLPALHAGRLLGLAGRADTDVLLLDSIAAAFLAPWLATHRLDRPLAAIAHQPPGGIDHGRLRTKFQAWADLLTYRRARRLLLASQALTESFVSAGIPEDRVRVVVPGRDVAQPPSGPAEDLREGRRTAFLSVGNWVARKGLLDLLEAFARLPAEWATLHLVGDTNADPGYAQQVRKRLSRADLAGRVRVHGPVSKERVARLYRDADLFVLPSLREPYGTVYGEAMAAGLPVVGWAAGNLPNLARAGIEGEILPRGDVEGLARALERLVTDPAYRASLASAARIRAQSFPTWAQSAELLFAELREVAATPLT
ncbi:MAG: glycosyltransferase family 4 protein [Actinomycetota bacterium]|nr:glycosyltransferase family 4 protein [Actinomycetota bacterium]